MIEKFRLYIYSEELLGIYMPTLHFSSCCRDNITAATDSDFTIVDWDRALEQCVNDEEFMKELFGDLTRDIRKQMPILAQAVVTRDYEQVVAIAHTFKGMALNVACDDFEEYSRILQCADADRDSAFDDLKKAFCRLEKCVNAKLHS